MIEILKRHLIEAMRAQDERKRSIVRVAIAEIERHKPSGKKDGAPGVVRKIIQGNTQTIEALPTGDPRRQTLAWENDFLSGLLPRTVPEDLRKSGLSN